MRLPEEFLEEMRLLLGDDYDAFLKSYDQPHMRGLRVNTLKISPETLSRMVPFRMTPVPWESNGYYVSAEDAVSRHPFYDAGLYYLQEPSAMAPAALLDVTPGMKVLDLCAAPGGKATALGAKLEGKGLLAANDISSARCRALLRNVELAGITNAFVMNETPAVLAERFPEYFDRILLDAPCSGEGMFRKDAEAVRTWSVEKSETCAGLQRELIVQAASMLRPGGRLMYSTCTFSVRENEEIIRWLLDNVPGMHLIEVPHFEGFSEGLEGFGACVRLWPHRIQGEGHFLALLEKEDAAAWNNGMTSGQETAYAAPASGDERKTDGTAGRPGAVALWGQKAAYAVSASAEQREMHGSAGRPGAVALWGQKAAYAVPASAEQRKTDGVRTYGSADRTGAEIPSGREASRAREKKRDRKSRDQQRREARKGGRARQKGDGQDKAVLQEFVLRTGCLPEPEGAEVRGGQVYLSAADPNEMAGLHFLRNGIYLGEIRKDRFEPSQSLALAGRNRFWNENGSADAFEAAKEKGILLDMPSDDPRIAQYLRGETLVLSEEEAGASGWRLVCADGYPLGWGKSSGGILKNKYPSGWRK